ncbi:hypothetical protein TVAG_281160 [Trichomonas vaginalis G3]|uniref:Nucleotide-diphospho-sugar transferase domain-containing protein n=1 Tax=Trichomonas vaginalis (strain ATCC PRA-98 / G3) TaxID=412133 RepID=A2DRN6_TRIV3|nr:hypothetical protein TVAGG3_0696430 [Trichomonas vaginalis G3]EAY16999.1 hypothetical protein TVAG_281160 [Trichomonas vaginalis G3]KAI5508948.1 hypothetical protein TVAGG3_0696430 [Trichomonas vaginalis G3]|eukprot:XP_001329222.1 hypothetical protein [Trichomonas vaginalis G3]
MNSSNINSFLNQVFEITIPTLLDIDFICFTPNFYRTDRFFNVFVDDRPSNLNTTRYIDTKTHTFTGFKPGRYTFNLITDWDSEDVIYPTIYYKNEALNTKFWIDSIEIRDILDTTNITHIYEIILLIISIATASIYFKVDHLNFLIALIPILIKLFNTNDIHINACKPNYVNEKSFLSKIFELKNYSSWAKFDEKVFKDALESKLDYSKCILCNYTPPIIYNNRSTEKDAIFMAYFNRPVQYESALTAHTAGFKGKIFIFSDFDIDERHKNRGIYIIPAEIKPHTDGFHSQYSRFPVMSRAISLVSDQIDRVIYVDSMDTIFQLDPFDFNNKKLQVSDQDVKYKKVKWYHLWIPGLFGFRMSYFKSGSMICSGVFGGKLETVTNFMKLVSGYYRVGENAVPDQAVMDVILQSDIPKKSGFYWEVNDGMRSIAYWMPDKKGKRYKDAPLGQYRCQKTGKLIPIVHQINRNRKLFNEWKGLCAVNK